MSIDRHYLALGGFGGNLGGHVLGDGLACDA